ncbi:MAG: acetoacetate decarboxylase family protein [Candidatus Binatia bacterium]
MNAPRIASQPKAPDVRIVQGREVRLPVEVRDASSAFATFVVDAPAVRKLWTHPRLRLVELFPGRALCSIAVIDYRDNDLGRYDEIAIAFLVREAGGRAVPVIDFFRRGVGAYIHHLPVTTSFSRDAGFGIWGYPKVVGEIEIEDRDGRRTGALRLDGRHVLTLSAPARGRFRFREAPLDSFALRDGALWKTPFTSSGESVGFRLGGATLVFGDHPIAEELRSIGLPRRALTSGWVGRMSARFGGPQRLDAAAEIF